MLKELLLGYPYLKKKYLLRKTEYWSKEKILEFQRSLLIDTLRYAVKNIRYYQELFTADEVDHITDPYKLINKFPVIDKELLRNKLDDFVNSSLFRKRKTITGGSSGQPLVFYLDRFTTRQREKAFIFDQWRRVGYTFGDKIFNLRGRAPTKNRFLQYDRFFNIYYASSFNLSKENIKDYIYHMNKIRPSFLHGYPSTIHQLALLVQSADEKLDFKYKAILCGSEKLFDYQREKIESIFGSRVYSWYGHSEYLALGGECEYSKRLHFYPQYGYIELLPTGIKNEAGKDIFELVATGFNNWIMPMIRYRTGDYAIKSKDQICKCGRNYLLIDEIIGRGNEFFVDANGTLISATALIFGPHYEVFSGLESIWAHQDTPGIVEIYLVKNDNYRPELLSRMKEQIEYLVEGRLKIHFSFSQKVRKSPIGKAKLVDQELDVRRYLR